MLPPQQGWAPEKCGETPQGNLTTEYQELDLLCRYLRSGSITSLHMGILLFWSGRLGFVIQLEGKAKEQSRS